MAQTPVTVCPHLGLVADRTVVQTGPTAGHRCYAQTPPGSPGSDYQGSYCLSADHTNCPYYSAEPAAAPSGEVTRSARPAWPLQAILPGIAVVAMLAVVAMVYGRDLWGPGPAPSGTSTVAADAAGNATVTQAAAAPAARPSDTRAGSTRFATPTPEAGGRTVTLGARAGDTGWWASGDVRGTHMGDSFLHTGYFDGKVFVSAIRFDLRSLPRGAPIRSAMVRLTGLQADRFDPNAGGSWSIQFLNNDPGAVPEDLGHMDFQKLFNAPSAVTLFPALNPADLGVRTTNAWTLDDGARDWLSQQILNGTQTVVARVVGPVGGSPTLFSWDSGSGPASAGDAPQLILAFGSSPASPPPLPTQSLVVMVLTPTPANVMTAAAYAVDATQVAGSIGTFTPVPGSAVMVTPTPLAANLATAQARAVLEGLAPLVIYTPVPANAATAEANAAYATAVAVTTGTFTPVPTNAITPVIVNPTPRPENVMTAAAQSIAATAQASRNGTPTPLPYGALLATVTPGPYLVTTTPTPANDATVEAQIVYATAVAVTTGTFTPMPPGAMTPTPPPPATPLPLLLEVTPKPTPSPTPGSGNALPAAFRGKVLFHTDRDGPTHLYLLDPATGQQLWVTQDWPFMQAQAGESIAPDGQRSMSVKAGESAGNAERVPQLWLIDNQFHVERQITHNSGWSYDPAWSPVADRIAFVSQEAGNDDIYLLSPDGKDPQRLTNNTWEWDKHPTWSPDGSLIVFWSNRESGRRQLWVMNADGSNQRRLLDSPYNDWDPIWVK